MDPHSKNKDNVALNSRRIQQMDFMRYQNRRPFLKKKR